MARAVFGCFGCGQSGGGAVLNGMRFAWILFSRGGRGVFLLVGGAILVCAKLDWAIFTRGWLLLNGKEICGALAFF